MQFSAVHGIIGEKGSELPAGDPRRKYKGRGILFGNRVFNQDWESATFTDLGIKGLEDVPYYGLSAPAGTPRAALDRLGSALQKTLAQPDVRDRLTAMGLSVGYTAGDALAARETAYRQAWARIIKDSGYQPQ